MKLRHQYLTYPDRSLSFNRICTLNNTSPALNTEINYRWYGIPQNRIDFSIDDTNYLVKVSISCYITIFIWWPFPSTINHLIIRSISIIFIWLPSINQNSMHTRRMNAIIDLNFFLLIPHFEINYWGTHAAISVSLLEIEDMRLDWKIVLFL